MRAGEFWTTDLEVMLDPGQRPASDGNITVFPPFALAHAKNAAHIIQVSEVEVAEFVAADAGGVEDFEDGAVTQPESRRSIGHGKYAFDFGCRENASSPVQSYPPPA